MTRDWFAVAAGPVAWFCAHVASWMLAPGAHEAGSVAGLCVIDAVALAIAVLAGVLALGRIRALRDASPDDPTASRAGFLARSGLGLSALSIVLIVGLALPVFLIAPGAEP